MLGLCWTPATVQNMQKMASTMPSNPEQLHGAILVRKDIFHRFETTMHDTCLDANNLLEYLFSLYNSTAAPAERENVPSPQSLGFIRRDSNHNRKSTGRGHHTFNQNVNMSNTPHLQQPVQPRPPESSRVVQPGVLEGHRKKMKLEQQNFHGHMNYTGHHQEYNQSNAVRAYDGYLVPGNKSLVLGVKMEHAPPPDMDPRHAQSASPLPPFSQIRRQGPQPYSPGSAAFADNLTTPPHDDGRQNAGIESNVECKVEGTANRSFDGQHPRKVLHGKAGKKSKASHEGGERTGRKKRTHQCFCGALFTRADNLKRHIRKCHEEKLEKLNSNPIDFEVDMSTAPITDFQNVFPPSSQEAVNSSQQQQPDSLQQPQHMGKCHEEKHEKLNANPIDYNVGMSGAPAPSYQTLFPMSNQQPQADSREQQQEQHPHRAEDGIKRSLKWSCFCGETFDDHQLMLEHNKSHDNGT
ncbi:alpha-protein kinase 1 [Biomphalaria pfeifferi]|uniref:Alpha-protein kinase 1 n=1 Tax=Biomphalaria pfeifferi TaxID=112525 RepID=A0AAD8B4S0_BIOPF|nr:alpha-protein kinase 1 [Biomphalaria pfeifferi]